MCRRLRDKEVKSCGGGEGGGGVVVMVWTSVKLSRSRCVHVKEC